MKNISDADLDAFVDPRDFLEAAGEALYGIRWQTSLSRDLEVSDRTVRNWSSGKFEIPDGVILDLMALVQSRRIELDLVERRAERIIDGILDERAGS